MKITILYDNTLFQNNLKSDWGFSCLAEAHGRTILFDTGANGTILLENMKKLNIQPSSVDDVFISHAHFDHVGGLSSFPDKNSNVTVFVPVSLRGIRNAKKVIYVDKPMILYENFYSTGELENIEQAMAVKTEKGLVLLVGCSHPDMKNIMDTASQFGKIYAIIGGLHGFDDYELLKSLDVICPTHCTQHIAEIKALYPEKYIEGGVGKIIEL
ncbi:MAG: MBL fold metallo-hydrolase [Bacteroidales bacterium]|nr:MBL fold metallo-hydrolase [Bacteroidales bacterium]